MGAETERQGAAVDIVEFVGIEPVVFYVVDFESAVWWDAFVVFELVRD